jgi:hypothetical protein
MKKSQPLEAPLSANERFLHAVAMRLDVLIEQVNSIVEHLAEKNEVAVTESKVEITPEVKEEVNPEVVKPSTRKRIKK